MYEWQKQIQVIVDEIDKCLTNYKDEALTSVSYTHLLLLRWAAAPGAITASVETLIMNI